MRVGYFGYCVKSRADDQKYLVNLQRFFKNFSKSPDVAFKSQFRHGGETLLLQPLDEHSNTYLFVQSRDLELVKQIQRRNLSAHDLSALIGANNGIGFASYVVIGDHWISFSCRVLSPRQTAFSHFANSLFQELGFNYDFVLQTFQTEVPSEVVPQLDKVGKIEIQINATSPIWQQAIDLFTGGDGEEAVDAMEMHVAIVPKRKRTANLAPTLNAIIDSVPEHGLESIKARAKLEETDRMADMFIYGSGAIRDYIFVEHENEVPTALKNAKRDNDDLNDLIEEYINEDQFETGHSASDLGISWTRARADHGRGD